MSQDIKDQSVRSAQQVYEQAKADGADPQVLAALEQMQGDVSVAAAAEDPEGAFLAWIRPMFDASAAYGQDLARDIAERSARDGRGVVLMTQMSLQHLAVLRGVASHAGSYQQALATIIDSYVKRGGR